MTGYRPISDVESAVTRTFDAPAELVFDAHVVPAHIQNWMLGPEGWTMPVCEFDARPGGAWRFVHRRADGTEITLSGTVVEVDRPHRLVTTERWGDGDWPETVNTLTLVERDGKTELTQAMRWPDEASRDRAMASGADDGVAASYARLDALLASVSAG